MGKMDPVVSCDPVKECNEINGLEIIMKNKNGNGSKIEPCGSPRVMFTLLERVHARYIGITTKDATITDNY